MARNAAVVGGFGLCLGCTGTIGDGSTRTGGAAGTNAAPVASADAGLTNSGEGDLTGDAGSADAVLLNGQELYVAYCSACHGPSGEGAQIGPEIRHPKPDFARWVVRNGYEGAYPTPMTPWGTEQLTDPQLDLILEYLGGLPQPETGAALYADYCANCHGQDARGGPARKEIAGRNELLEDTRRGKGGTSYGARTRYMPGWGTSELSSTQLALLQDFVGSLPEP